MAKIYGAFTPGQTLCQHFPNIISFNPHNKIQEIETIFNPPFRNEETEAQRGEATDAGSHSSWMVDFRDLVVSSQRLSSSALCVLLKVLPCLHLRTFQDKGSMNGFRGSHLLKVTQPRETAEAASGPAFLDHLNVDWPSEAIRPCPAHVPQNELSHHPKPAVF